MSATDGHSSINGLGTFATLLRNRGHEIRAVNRLFPNVGVRADVIVWAPDDFAPPSDAARKWMEDWLVTSPGRTLVFVVHDYDAEADYWAAVAPQAPPELAGEVGARAAAARGRIISERSGLGAKPDDWGWFTYDGTLKPRMVTTLAGDPAWINGVNPAKVQIPLNGRMSAKSPNDELLLESSNDAIVLSHPVANSQVMILTNGSFVLNYGLINQEHRKLAGSLIDEIGADRTVVFLEATSNPQISEKDPEFSPPSPLKEFGEAPFFPLYSHLAVLAVLACFAYWPLFGRPRDDKPRNLADFGEHVQALGELLKNTKNTTFARARLMHYQQLARAEGKRRKAFVIGGGEGASLPDDAAPVEMAAPAETTAPAIEAQSVPLDMKSGPSA